MKSKCEHYIGMGPYAPMCTNPLYETGNGMANAYCETCRYRMEKLEAENDKLRELVDYMTPIALYAASEQERDRMRELGVEVDE